MAIEGIDNSRFSPHSTATCLMCLVTVSAVISAGITSASAADKLMAVNWSDPELRAFAAEQVANPPRSLGPTADDKLAKLKLPVLAFEEAPRIVENTFRLGPKPATKRDVVVDEANPVWYQITEDYGDVTISIQADLRIQHTFPASFPIYKDKSRSAAPTAGPSISVFNEQNEQGEEGLMAEYTIMKYGVPYTVTIECSAAAKSECRDTSQIGKDSELLKLVRANAPK